MKNKTLDYGLKELEKDLDIDTSWFNNSQRSVWTQIVEMLKERNELYASLQSKKDYAANIRQDVENEGILVTPDQEVNIFVSYSAKEIERFANLERTLSIYVRRAMDVGLSHLKLIKKEYERYFVNAVSFGSYLQ